MPGHIQPPENCTGCGLCANVCAKNAIRMVWNKDGFLVPRVDTSTCVNCKQCIRHCIALEDKATYTDDISSVAAYGGWNKNTEIHLHSSSGGIFTAIARETIQRGGIVFGVVWQDKVTAVFDKASTEEELARMRGSKYTPAVPGYVHRDVLNELKSGRQVLFCGTPCQVHALKKYLRTPHNNLLTIDIVCHGTPSHLILEKYVTENEKRTGKIIDHISFRDKPEGWRHFHVTRHYTDGSTSSDSLNTDMYMRMFLSDTALNYACYNCPYAHIPRQGDITLGDYWGVENHHPDWPIDKGISAILANTAKGDHALKQLSDTLDLHNEPFKNIYAGQDVVYIRPQKQVPEIRAHVLAKLHHWTLVNIHRCLVNSTRLGPIRLPSDSIICKTIIFAIRVAKFIKRKIITQKWPLPHPPPKN